MTEALITELAQIRSLRVISRTSAMRYRGSGKAVPEIARELSVDAVVEGSVLRSGTRVRITAQLIHAATDSHLWSGSFERNLGDIVSLQDEIARAIAAQLEITLTATEEERLRRGRPVAPDAYDAFLIGQYFVSRGQYGKGADAFEEATKKDPSFALAHAMLCEADSMVTHGLEQPARERALRAMETARKLDDSLAEVHMIVGDKLFYEDWDWAAGEAEFRRAVKIDPGSVQAAMHYMFCLHAQTRWDEAIREGRRALHLDPASPRLNTQWINLLRHSGRHDEALAAFHKLLRLGPEVPGERNRGLANIYQGMGREDEAISALLKADASLSVPPAELDKREAAARTGGLRGYWNAVLQSQPRQSPLRPVALALLHVQAGRNEEALDWLETAFRQRSPRLAWLKAYSGFDPLRSHPRFRALVRQMRLPP
jgi:tetratricopeptide (TPR) repeat protein